jgi:hypothetical protein
VAAPPSATASGGAINAAVTRVTGETARIVYDPNERLTRVKAALTVKTDQYWDVREDLERAARF